MSNYTVPASATGPGAITPLGIIGSITAADKVFDATTAATITSRTLTGVVGPDTVTYTGGTATFDTMIPGTDKTVTGTGLTLTGTDAGNYSVNSTATTLADIAAIPVVPTLPVSPPVIPLINIPALVVLPPPVTSPVLIVEVPVTPPDAPTRTLDAFTPIMATPAQPPAQPVPVATPREAPPVIYVPPVRPRKPDRN